MGKGKGDNSCSLGQTIDKEQTRGILALGIPRVYRVGGFVRDRLMGKPPKDMDVMACGISGQELLDICRAHGRAEPLKVGDQLIGVRLTAEWTDSQGIEIALARREISTGDGHRDFKIIPEEPPEHLRQIPLEERGDDASLKEQALRDLYRRDFTCNAIAQDLNTGELLDPWGGQADIRRGILRVVSPESFRDDPLRMLRGIGRIAQDNLTPSPDTEESARQSSVLLHSRPGQAGALSPERIRMELEKIMSGSYSAKALGAARDWGLWPGISAPLAAMVGFDQRNRYHSLSLDEHVLKSLEQADRMGLDRHLKLAILFHDVGKPGTAKPGRKGGLSYYRADSDNPLWQTEPQRARAHEDLGGEIARGEMERLAYPRREVAHVEELVRNHMFAGEVDFRQKTEERQRLLARKMLSRHGEQVALELCQIRICDLAGKEAQSPGYQEDALCLMRIIRQESGQPTSIKELKIDGNRLQQMGLERGPKIQKVLDNLLKIVVGDPAQNRPEQLEKHAAQQIKQLG